MMRSMSEKRPEQEVIERSLAGLIPGIDQSHNPGIAWRIWEDLLEYWKNRAGGKVKSDEPIKSPFEGGSAIPGEGYHYKFTPPLSIPVVEEDKYDTFVEINPFKDYVLRRLDDIYQELHDLAALDNVFSEKERVRLSKVATKLGNFNDKAMYFAD